MSWISVNADALRSNGKDLESYRNELTQLNQRLEALITRIGDSWEGDASAAYISRMREYKAQADNCISVYGEFKNYIDSAADEFEQQDKDTANQILNAF